MRTRNFKARNGLKQDWPRVKKGEKSSLRGKWDCYQWKAIGHCSKRLLQFQSRQWETGAVTDKRDNRPLLLQKARTQTDGKNHRKVLVSEEKSFLEWKAKKTFKKILRWKCTNPSCDYWHPPVCQNYKSESGCQYGDDCQFRHTEFDGQPSKKSKNSGGKKDQLPYWKESIQLGCVSQDDPPRKSFLQEVGKLGRITPSNSPEAHGTSLKFGNDRVHREEFCKSANLKNAISVRQNLRKEHKMKLCNKRDAPAEKHGNWRKMSTSSKKEDKATFYSPTEARAMPAPSLKNSRGVRIRGRLRSINAHAEQRGFKLRRTGNPSKVQEPHNGCNGQWESANERESTGICLQPWSPWLQLLEHTPAVLSLGKVCEGHRYSYEWTSG